MCLKNTVERGVITGIVSVFTGDNDKLTQIVEGETGNEERVSYTLVLLQPFCCKRVDCNDMRHECLTTARQVDRR